MTEYKEIVATEMTEEDIGPIVFENNKRRVKRSATAEWSIRITPTNQEPINKNEFLEKGLKDAELLLVCEEGTPNGSPKLHYHIYIKCNISRTTLERYCANIGRATNYVKGNAVFSIKSANEGTIGYVIKDCNIIISDGFNNHHIEEYIQSSKQYRKGLETTRRNVNKDKNASFKELFDQIESYASADDIIAQILIECNKRGMTFPSRSLMESNVLRLMYKVNPQWVNAFYQRNYNVYMN